jgi:hypothetical protein
MSFWTKISLCVLKVRGFKGGIGVPKPRGFLNSTGAGLLNHQTSKNSPILFWTKIIFLVYELQEFEGGIGVPKRGGSLNSIGQELLNLQKSKNSPNGGGIGDLCGGGGGHYTAWRGLGVWHRNPRDDLRASFSEQRTWCPRAHWGAQ